MGLARQGAQRFGAVFFDLDGTLLDHKGASEAAVDSLLDRYGVAGSRRREADEAFSVYLGFYESGWRAFRDVVPALDALSDVRKGVLTNGDPDQQRGKLRALGLAGHFEAVVASGDVGASKPDPAIFRAACAAVQLAPASCVHVGDSLDADARAATEAGMLGVWLDRRRSACGGTWLPENDLPAVHELTELPAILR